MKLRLHDRYFFREMLAPLAITLAAFVMMMVLQLLFGLMDLITGHRLPLGTLFVYILFKLPLLIQWSLPVSLLVGSSLALSRLTHDTELVPMRVGGLPLWRFLCPLAVLGLAMSFISGWIGENVAPPSEHRAEAIHRKLTSESEVAGLKPDTVFRSDNSLYYYHLFIPVTADHQMLQDVVVYDLPEAPTAGAKPASSPASVGPTKFWTAEHADVEGQKWTLFAVTEHQLSPSGEIIADVPIGTKTIDLHRNIRFFLSNSQTPQELTAADLAVRIRADEHLSVPDSVILPLRYEYSFRLALPFACLVFSLIGAPLTLRFGRGGSLIGILVSFGVLFFYYDLMMIDQKLALSGALDAGIAAWLPNILFGALGVYLILHES